MDNSLMWGLVVVFLGWIGYIPVAVAKKAFTRAFLAPGGAIAALCGLLGLGLYPRMVPSSIDLALTARNKTWLPLPRIPG